MSNHVGMRQLRNTFAVQDRFQRCFYTKQISPARWELAGYIIKRKTKGVYKVIGHNGSSDHPTFVATKYLHTLGAAQRMIRNIYVNLWLIAEEIEREQNKQ